MIVFRMTTKNFKTLHVYDTVFCADSVEWCPISPYRNSFACGTYHLLNSNSESGDIGKKRNYERTGGVSIFTVQENKLEANFNTKCSAVLDLKWCPRRLNSEIVLAAANSEGEVCLFSFNERILKLMCKCVLKKETGDLLVLSIDWSKVSPDLICASDSKGNITIMKFCDGALTALKKWNGHSLEAWIVCFDSFNSSVIFSGGDEANLKVWDCRDNESTTVASSRKHTSGVTALNSNIHNEYNLISGSYDENIIFWDTRNWKQPIEMIKASGGIWRLKWEPKVRSRFLLAACIYGGFQIYDTNTYSVVGEYKEHESLAYGADWCYLDNNDVNNLLGNDESALIATCSFYDHKLCVSMFDESANEHE